MKMDRVSRTYKKFAGIEISDTGLNRIIKAVIINFGHGDIPVYNDNFGTRRRHLDFTEGRKAVGLHPLTVVFAGVDFESVLGGRFIGPDDKIHQFSELVPEEEEEI